MIRVFSCGLEIAEEEPLTIRGTTVCEGDHPRKDSICKALVQFWPENQYESLYTREDGPGHWELGPVFPGTYRWRVTGGYVDSVFAGGHRVAPGQLITIPRVRSLPEWRIRLKRPGGTVAAVLTGEAAAAGLLLIPKGVTYGNPQLLRCGWRYACELSYLAPGDYTIFAVDNAQGMDYRDPEVTGALQNGVPVSVKEKTRITVVIDKLAR